MKLTKYICANILSLVGLYLLILFILLVITDINFNGTNELYGISLFVHYDIYITSIFFLIAFLMIDILINKLFQDKYTINIQLKNKNLLRIYNILFYLGVVCSFAYLALYLWFISKS